MTCINQYNVYSVHSTHIRLEQTKAYNITGSKNPTSSTADLTTKHNVDIDIIYTYLYVKITKYTKDETTD